MTPRESAKLIESAGGDEPFAMLLGLDPKTDYRQRVNNWRRRGIPARILLDHQETIRELQQKSRAA